MDGALAKGYVRGTHRLIPPEQTLERITPQLAAFGVTRCADITGLDCIGIPVYTGIRPRGRVLQVSNGKGLRHVDAKVSALMEAIELFHAENANLPLRRASVEDLRREGARHVEPWSVLGFRGGARVETAQVFEWALAEELRSGDPSWVPAFAACHRMGQHHSFHFNGLSSGNNLEEATLHGLYEVIERDTLSRLVSADGKTARFDACGVVDLDTVRDEAVGSLVERIRRADLGLVLLRAPTSLAVHTFMAVLLDGRPFASASTVNLGYGAHLSASVAATRAITEAAQSRLTFIHGAREDLPEVAYRSGAAQARLYEFFSARRPDLDFGAIEDAVTGDLGSDLDRVIEDLPASRYPEILRVDLSRPETGIAVTKILVQGALFTMPV
jgi:ribosomal protein S12 methylthiotransferase accessory factor